MGFHLQHARYYITDLQIWLVISISTKKSANSYQTCTCLFEAGSGCKTMSEAGDEDNGNSIGMPEERDRRPSLRH